MWSTSSTSPTKKRNVLAAMTTHPAVVCGMRKTYVSATAKKIATPPIIAVGLRCQRSAFGLATIP